MLVMLEQPLMFKNAMANWETPDWDCLPEGGWWKVVHHPMVYAMVRPIEPLLPHNTGFNYRCPAFHFFVSVPGVTGKLDKIDD